MLATQDRLAEDYLTLAKAQSRTLGAKLQRWGITPDFDELESDANLFLFHSIQKFEKTEGERTAAYFQQGLKTWAKRYAQDTLKHHNSSAVIPESLPDDFDRERIEPEVIEDEEEREDQLIEAAGDDENCGKDLKVVVKRVLKEGWTKDQIRQFVGRNRYYRVILPAIADLTGADLTKLREGECQIEK